MARVSIVEALIMFLITIMILYVMEVTLGAAFDQMAYTFATIVVPGSKKDIIMTYLGMFKQIHLIVGIMVIMTGVWVIRVMIFEHEYDRGL